MDRNDTHRYDDIINLPHHVSATHPQMSRQDRAAQFAPFAALSGHGEAIRETARLTQRREELDENRMQELDQRLRQLQKRLPQRPRIRVTYFVPDEKKCGGAYVTVSGVLKQIDIYKRMLMMETGALIPMDEIYEIEEMVFE